MYKYLKVLNWLDWSLHEHILQWICLICMHTSNILNLREKRRHLAGYSCWPAFFVPNWINLLKTPFLHLLNNILYYLISKSIKILKNLSTSLIVYHSILMTKMVTTQLYFLCHITPSSPFISSHLIHQFV